MYYKEIRQGLTWYRDQLIRDQGIPFRCVVVRNAQRAGLPARIDAWSDAATTTGLAACCGEEFFQCSWKNSVFGRPPKCSINLQEMWAACAAAKRWAKQHANGIFCLGIDNFSVVQMMNGRDVRKSHFFAPLKEALEECEKFGVFLVARYVSSATNIVADTLSRVFPIGSSDLHRFGLSLHVQPIWTADMLQVRLYFRLCVPKLR